VSLHALSSTARWAAAARARETDRSDRLFCDPLAGTFAGEEGREWQRSFEESGDGPVENAFLPIRTRFFDDLLARAAGEEGIRQVVLVAAGFDVRAVRLDWPAGTVLYELDQPGVLDHKDAVLTASGAPPRCVRRPVRADLREDWTAALRAAGFEARRPAAWIVEGLTPYLDERRLHTLLRRLSAVAAPGSLLGLDVLSRRYFAAPWAARDLRFLAERGTPWRFGTDDPAALLAGHGWRSEIARPGDQGADYGRWPHPDALSYLVVARRA
jgi:methyltransferase (TIGR00027 family)